MISEPNIKDHGASTRLKGKFDWGIVHDPACDKWVGICEDLNLTVQADTQRELHVSIWEAMDSLFSMLVEEGELHHFLVERGWDHLEEPESKSVLNFPVSINLLGGALGGAAA